MHLQKDKYTTLIFIRSLLKGGSEKQSLILQKNLQSQERSLLIVLNNSIASEFKEIIRNEKIDVLILTGNLIRKISDLIKIYKFNDIKVTISYLFTDNLVSAIYGKIYRVPKIIGGYRSSSLTSRFKFWIQRFLCNFVFTDFIVNSYEGKSFLEANGFTKERLKVIQNGIELNESTIIREVRKSIVILTVGRFDYFKAYQTSLQVIRELINICPDANIQYHIVGYGSLESELRKWIKTIGFSGEEVEVFIDPKDVPSHYKNADIYLSTSLSEGMSNSIMEAMNWSLPIVATKVGDNDYLIKEDINGYLCAVNDKRTLARKLKMLIDSETRRKRMGQKSYEILAESFGVDSLVNQYKMVIES